ncbi:MAG: bifunctional 4-hydroxy-2-oxoglutarate aldolase/2-dehydro-3-deoxy-phosphogluconate aldolase [Gammaproteobacteria bacterium]|nr:bifunctional 4-hydroxy-2-oxoglutarate aldolase/2-dehydro-3-deoxy-phosphogluconate aldolase [Gammaproteobacteria bacterium]
MKNLLVRRALIPVVTVEHADEAIPLAEALLDGGLDIMEVTLRTAAAIPAIKNISHRLPQMIVGAGTIRHPDDFFSVSAAGARFVVCPGTPAALWKEAAKWDIAFLPAAATPTEMMRLQDAGYSLQKFFPCTAMGGLDTVRALQGPLPDLTLCPSGGINETNFMDYLAEPNVAVVSGSWMAPRSAIAAKDWSGISRLVRTALQAGIPP